MAPTNQKGQSMIKVKLLRPWAKLPTRSYHSAGYDLYAAEGVVCQPHTVTKVGTGIATELPPGHAGLVWDRSGMGKKGLTVFGGVVDEDYRGEWFVMLYNGLDTPYEIKAGDRVAQFLVQAVVQEELEAVDELTDTERGDGAFSSTGR
jgi:dUTP pyrophosphatase